EDRQFFHDVANADGHFIVRGTKKIRPTIRRAYNAAGHRLRWLENKTLSWRRLPRETVDLDIEWDLGRNGSAVYKGRIVAIYREEARHRKAYTYLHTNLARATF